MPAESPSPESQLSPALKGFFLGLVLFVLAVSIYAPAYSAGFIWDDDQLLTANPQVHGPNGWWTLWLQPHTADYFPLTSTTLWLEYHLGQWWFDLWNVPFLQHYASNDVWNGYHIVNVLLHGLVAILTWQMLKRLRAPGAWVAAAIFAVHPVCVDTAAWIAERTNILAQIFLLLTIIAWIAFEDTGGRRFYVAAFACFLLALFAKSTVVMLPVILMILSWWRRRKIKPLLLVPFLLASLVLGIVTIYFQFYRAIGGEEIPMGNWWQRIASACLANGFYLYSAIWPFNIMPVYPEWHRAFSTFVALPTPHIQPPSPESLPFWLQAITGLPIAGLFVFCWTRRSETWARAIVAALACYIVAILPVLGLVTMSYTRLTLFADHYQYISIIAVIALFAAAGATKSLKPIWLCAAALVFAAISDYNWILTKDNRAAEIIWIASPLLLAAVLKFAPHLWRYTWGGFLAAVIFCFSVISWREAAIYHSEKTFMIATLAKNPENWQAHNHLGAALYMEGDVKGAYPHFAEAVRLKPENPESHNNLGLAYTVFGNLDDAIKQYKIAVYIKDDSAMETNLGNAYEQNKQHDMAIKTYLHAIELNSTNASAHCNLGYAYMQVGKTDEAIPEFMDTIECDPGMPQGHTDLQQALRMKGIDPNAKPPKDTKYPFDLQKALELLNPAPRY